MPQCRARGHGARLPVVTTPAGDAGVVVDDGVSGYVVPFDDVDAMAGRMIRLAESRELRQRMGEAGRRRVENAHSYDGLAGRLMSVYEAIAGRHGRRDILAAIARLQRPQLRSYPGQTVEIRDPVLESRA